MNDLNVTLLPDLDAAEVAEIKDMRVKRFAHIEYIRKSDNSLLMLSRPFGDYPVFYIPIKSLESQYEQDLEVIRKSHLIRYAEVFAGIDKEFSDELMLLQ